ncbi:MAG: Holliday junction branch migration protein RuvA [Bacteroidia bacterium]
MIAYLNGKVAHLEPAHVVIDCGGIGYLVRISLHTYTRIREKETVKLHTHFMVREDAQVLYGFSETKELMLFEQLIGISGVGGNTALLILSSMSPDDLYHAIRNEDSNQLRRVKGIGTKTAGRIILELKDRIKLEGEGGTEMVVQTPGRNQVREEALAALVQLGFARAEMMKRVDRILAEQGEDLTVEQIIKQALRNA